MKKLLLLNVLLIIAMSVFAAGQKDTAKNENEIVIGVCMKNTSDQFVKNIADAIELQGQSYDDVKLLMLDAAGDLNQQISQMENLVAQNVDAIILNAQDASGLDSAVDMVIDADIPLVEVNTLTNNSRYTVYVGSDDVDAGRIQAEYLNSVLPQGANAVIMHGNMGQSPQVKRREGIGKYLLEGRPDINLLAEQTANWKRDQAMNLTEDWMQRFPELDVIITQNDDMAMGTLIAVESAGKLDDIIVVGIDAIPDALQAVADGKLSCTVFQDSKGQGAKAVETAVRLAKGESLPKEVMIPFQLVTIDNVSDFIGLNK
jgi:ABC-type sugar transport system substrate-binding protein